MAARGPHTFCNWCGREPAEMVVSRRDPFEPGAYVCAACVTKGCSAPENSLFECFWCGLCAFEDQPSASVRDRKAPAGVEANLCRACASEQDGVPVGDATKRPLCSTIGGMTEALARMSAKDVGIPIEAPEGWVLRALLVRRELEQMAGSTNGAIIKMKCGNDAANVFKFVCDPHGGEIHTCDFPPGGCWVKGCSNHDPSKNPPLTKSGAQKSKHDNTIAERLARLGDVCEKRCPVHCGLDHLRDP